jgi:hypothetical protein
MKLFKSSLNSLTLKLIVLFSFTSVIHSVSLTGTEGIEYFHIFLEDYTSVHILEVNPHLFNIVSVKAESLETVAEISKNHHALAAINGGFFLNKGEVPKLSRGILKISENWYATPHKPRGAIGWSNSDPHVLIDQILTAITGNIDGEELEIHGINIYPRKDNEAILYNHHFHQTTLTSESGREFLINENTVLEEQEGNMNIPIDSHVISFGTLNTSWISKMKIGSSFTWNIQIIPKSCPPYTTSEQWEHSEYIVGGTPVLIRAGNVITDFSIEQTISTFLYSPHARTAIGIKPNGNWIFIVVDGKNSLFWSTGITIPDLAQFMHSLGCMEALNFDGGGSSTMILNGEVINVPSGDLNDGTGHYVRKVSDAILIVPKE